VPRLTAIPKHLPIEKSRTLPQDAALGWAPASDKPRRQPLRLGARLMACGRGGLILVRSPFGETSDRTEFLQRQPFSVEGDRSEVEPAMVDTIRVELTARDLAMLRKPVAGKGGMQSLLRSLRKRIESDGSLRLTVAEVERIRKYSRQTGGSGGFQGRLGPLIRTLRPGDGNLDEFR
jgi:hypothetical protein